MPDPNSIAIMAVIDDLSFEYRKLVHEYGALPVTRFMNDYESADELRDALETWRQRLQNSKLVTE